MEEEKKKLSQKLLEFQKKGLELYKDYLLDQLNYADNSVSRKAYKKYVEDQIEMNNEKIINIDKQLVSN